jgi:putative transport protein
VLSWLKESLNAHAELAVFLAVGLGALIGRIPLGRHAKLGLIPGTLVVGVVVGDLADLKVPAELSGAFFTLFLFGIGIKVGPQFFHGLRSTGVQQAAVVLVVAVSGVAVTVGLSRLLGFGTGEGGGLLAGGMTQSAAVATASDTIGRAGSAATATSDQQALVAVGYAVTYLFGAAGAAWWTATVLPRLLGFDLRLETERYRAEVGARELESGTEPAYTVAVQRTYRVTSPQLAGRSVAELEARAAEHGQRIFALAVRRGTERLEVEPDLRLAVGDVVAVTGRREAVVAAHLSTFGEEVDDPELLDEVIETVGAVVTAEGMAGRTIAELRQRTLERGVFVGGLTRAGTQLDMDDTTAVQAGDELRLTGLRTAVESTATHIGFLDRDTPQSDITTICLGIVVGGLVGLPSIDAANTTLRLGSTVGALVAGLVFGWLRSRRPTFGRVPPAAQWVFETFALALAIAVIGINAGPSFVDGVRSSGIALLAAGVVVTLVPLTLGAFVAHKVFRMPAPLALGAVCGAQTSTPSLAATNEAAASQLPTLGYTVPYAIGNVLLTLAGSVVVLLL